MALENAQNTTPPTAVGNTQPPTAVEKNYLPTAVENTHPPTAVDGSGEWARGQAREGLAPDRACHHRVAPPPEALRPRPTHQSCSTKVFVS